MTETRLTRLRAYAEHTEGCDALKWPHGASEPGTLPCTCGLDALLKEIDGDDLQA